MKKWVDKVDPVTNKRVRGQVDMTQEEVVARSAEQVTQTAREADYVAAENLSVLRHAAMKALEEEQLAARALDVDAPQAIKDYVAAKGV